MNYELAPEAKYSREMSTVNYVKDYIYYKKVISGFYRSHLFN